MQWSVQAEDGRTVGEVLRRMVTEGAPVDGRVFLNGRPAELEEPVDVGDHLTIYPRRPLTLIAPEVLAQRDGVVLVFKPAGLPAETTKLGEDSLVSALLSRFKGGRVHVATRLDTMVSGVAVCCLGRDASRRVAAWREAGLIRRTYLAITVAPDRPHSTEGIWDWPLGRQRDRGGRHIASPRAPRAKPARTRYRVLGHADEGRLLELSPETGRMHQIRAHAAEAGLSLYGDGRYGGPTSLVDARGAVQAVTRLALHALRVELPHLAAEVPAPDDILGWWSSLGGDAALLSRPDEASE